MKIVFENCSLLDGTKDMEVQPNMYIVVENNRILSIGKEEPQLTNAKMIDLKGKYLMPGLINMHTHLPGSGKPMKSASGTAEKVNRLLENRFVKKIAKSICYKSAKLEVLSGVTTTRTVGGLGDIDTSLRDEIASGKKIGPRILASNMAISVPGGHMAGSLAYIANSAKEARDLVDVIAKDHPDLIKLMITGGVLDAEKKGEPGVLRMPSEYVKAACDRAHELGFMVAAHVESSEGVKVALENGVDTIEHGAKLDDELIALFKEKQASLICTISPAIPLALLNEDHSPQGELYQFNGNVVFEGICLGAKKALENDIPVGLGTDTGCPYITHYDTWRELVYFCKYVGVSKATALYSATLGNAKILKMDHLCGSIEVGKFADFIITDENPLMDLKALRQPYMVVANGNVITNPKVKRKKAYDDMLDTLL